MESFGEVFLSGFRIEQNTKEQTFVIVQTQSASSGHVSDLLLN